MKTEIFTDSTLSEAVSLLKKGELVAFPTETVYGLGASVFRPEAIQKIFEVKGRPQDNPLIVHLGALEDVEKVAKNPPQLFFALAEAFFPGPLTVILSKHPSISPIVTGGLETVALRIPSHPTAQKLITLTGDPLVAPSANTSGKPSSTTLEHVLDDFSGKIAGVIEGEPCQFGMESTVLDLVNFAVPTLLRPGAISKKAIEEMLGYSIEIYQKGPQSSPGMRYRHYSPNIPVFLFRTKEELARHLEKGKKSFVVSCIEEKTLYAHLRHAEKKGYDEVLLISEFPLSDALENRLEKILELPSLIPSV